MTARPLWQRWRKPIAAVAALGVGVTSCGLADQATQTRTRTSRTDVVVQVLDEGGDPLPDALLELTVDLDGDGDNDLVRTDGGGQVSIPIRGPIVAVVSAPGRLDEPVAIDPRDPVTTVRLWDRIAGSGLRRQSLHFGGDVMLGRRYLDESSATVPVIDAASARAVVDDLAPMSSAADWTVVNLETVIGDLPVDQALQAKRFLLQSTPHVTAALDEMGVDLVTLGNNHAYDWGEAGVASTLQILDDAGMPHVGAGFTDADARRGRLDKVGALQVGTISMTTVNGSFVNDQLPAADAPLPEDLPLEETWQYERRTFGFDSGFEATTIALENRRIGDAWAEFERVERDMDTATITELWDAITEVYPELQDWVARRGHGGAAAYERGAMEAEIAELRADGASMVVVQVHGGFQFAEVASDFVGQLARRAVDAGADIVIAHHPHVLQGVEWYNGKLIAYSLGNLVFDQNFLDTFPSMLVRAIVDDRGDVLEVRLLPIMLDRYRPVPAVGATAETILRTVHYRSAIAGRSDRVDELRVGTVMDPTVGERTASVVVERNSGRVVEGRTVETLDIVPDASGRAVLPSCTIVRSDLLPDDVELGVDLFDWGRFDDDLADNRRLLPMHWKVPVSRERWAKVEGVSGLPFDDALEFRSDPNRLTTGQIGARIDAKRHRLYDIDNFPLDAPARYEVMMDVKRSRGEDPSIRLVSFDFDDTDPTAAAETARVHEVVLDVEVPSDGRWRALTMDVPATLLADGPNGERPNVATMLIDVPPALRGSFTVDNVRIVEWRTGPSAGSPAWVDADLVRSTSTEPFTLEVSTC